MAFPRKFRFPMTTGMTRNELLENSAFMNVRPSAIEVPVPTEQSVGTSCSTSVPKLEPVCCSGVRRYPIARR
jgi:hypothetical protein